MKIRLDQDITYWAPGTQNQFGGKVFASPVVLKGRWEDKMENITDAQGQQAVSRAQIYTESAIVDDGYLAQGDHTDTDPTTLQGVAFAIRIVGSVPSISSLQRLYTAYI